MKSRCFTLFLPLVLAVASPASAQSSPHAHEPAGPPAAADEAAFDKLKALAGSWVGQLTTTPEVPAVNGNLAQFSLRVTSRGHALVHELSLTGLPDHPLTMFYLDGGRVVLTHYCDAGNRPRMAGRLSPDGKTLAFDFLDLAGGNEHGHMDHAVFTFIDDNHHTEEWTYMGPGDVPVRAHFDLRRTNFDRAAAR